MECREMETTTTNPTRIITQTELRKRVPFSPVHLWRLEKAGTFPRRVKLGVSRIGWVEAEVEEWLRERIAAR